MRRIILIKVLLVALLMSVTDVYAQNADLNLDAIKRIPILEQGRIKPLDTYARNVLLQFSGKTSYQRTPALAWLADLLWVPEKVASDKVFLINNPEVVLALGVLPDPHRRYSFSQLTTGFRRLQELAMASAQIPDKERTIVEKELRRVYENSLLYIDLSYSLRFSITHSDFIVNEPGVYETLQLPREQKEFSFLDIALKADLIKAITDSLEKKSPEIWTPVEKDIFRLLTNLYQWSLHYRNMPFKIIPPMDPNNEELLSPWDAISDEFKTPTIREEIIALNDLYMAFTQGSQEDFDRAGYGFVESVLIRAKHFRSIKFLSLEVFYNQLKPFAWAQALYVIALFCCLINFLYPFSSSPSAQGGSASDGNPSHQGRGILNKLNSLPLVGSLPAGQAGVREGEKFLGISLVLIILGFLTHTFGVISRILIMGRPPVTNLYETFIFVGWVSVVFGILSEFVNRRGLGILIASVCGFILLLIAGKFSTEGDTLRVMGAVLNSNFWLSTHVIAITTGYAGCCVAGVIGHIYLIQALVKPRDTQQLDITYKLIMGALGFGLMMSFLGTVLGGIWADQSWGRFWGWDPKENGALMIVLWCSIILHAKVADLIGPLGVAVSSALGIIVVAWAWFGVNLLSVGLHSYGFTSGVAANLIIYVVLELVFLTTTGFIIFNRRT